MRPKPLLALACLLAVVAGLMTALAPSQQPTLKDLLATKQVVQLQPGEYVVSEPIILKPYQTLRGEAGTKLLCRFSADPTKAVVELDEGSVAENLTIHHEVNPNKAPTMDEVNSYPWGLKVRYCVEHWRISNVKVVNGPRGILSYGTNGVIENSGGGCWYRGLVADTCGHCLTINNLQWNEPIADITGDFDHNPLIQFQRAYGQAFVFQRVDGLRATNLFAARHRYGIVCQGSFSPYDTEFWLGSRPGGFIQGGGLECSTALRVDWTQPTNPMWSWTGQMLTLSNFYVSCDKFGTPVEITGGSTAADEPSVTLDNWWFSALPDNEPNSPYVRITNAKVSLSNHRLWNPDKWNRNLFLRQESGTLEMVGGHIEGVKSRPAVILGSKVRSATITGVGGLSGRISSMTNAVKTSALTEP